MASRSGKLKKMRMLITASISVSVAVRGMDWGFQNSTE